jgi:hypothetical protein
VDRLLSWRPGTQTSTLILRWSQEHSFAFPGNVPFGVASYVDSAALTDPVYCYVLLAYLGDLSNPSVQGISDLLCIFPGTSSGAQSPGQFRIQLGETNTVTLNWSPAGGQDHYQLLRTRFDNTSPPPIQILGDQTSFSEVIGNQQATCYQLFALNGVTPLGATDRLCAVPNLSSFTAGGATRAASNILDRAPLGASRAR